MTTTDFHGDVKRAPIDPRPIQYPPHGSNEFPSAKIAEPFEAWAIVEIMGHDRYAGRVSEQTIGGTSFVRVDVPEVDDIAGFTKLFGSSAIFSLTIVTKEAALAAVKQFRPRPVQIYGYSPQRQLPLDEDTRFDEEGFSNDGD